MIDEMKVGPLVGFPTLSMSTVALESPVNSMESCFDFSEGVKSEGSSKWSFCSPDDEVPDIAVYQGVQ